MTCERDLVRVALVGQQFWAERLQRAMDRYAPGDCRMQRVSLRALLSPACIGRIRRSHVILRIGYRPGSPSALGRGFDAFWNVLRKLVPRGVAVHYWIGTDVYRTVQDHASGRLRSKAFGAVLSDHHLAGSQGLADELADVAISATVIPIPVPLLRAVECPAFPPTFRVLTYIPDYRYRFYGGEAIYEAAKCLPHVPFDVVGGRGGWVPHALANLHFHGWQNDLEPFYRNCCVVVRMVEHDSIGCTVLEGISFARHVLYSYSVPHTQLVRFGDIDTLIQRLGDLERLHRSGLLKINLAGWEYARREFDESRAARALASFLRAVCPRSECKEQYARA